MKASLLLAFLFIFGLGILPKEVTCHKQQRYLLVHGASAGAYRWYKVVAGLLKNGDNPTAVDLLALGKDETSACNVTSIAIWARNAATYLQNLPAGEKAIVVAHSAGGLVAQYLSENFPEKIKAVVYVAAVFPGPGQCALNVVSPANAALCSFPAPSLAPCTLPFNSTVSLASPVCTDATEMENVLGYLSDRPQPAKVFLESVQLTADRFGSVRRFWVKTLRDNLITPAVQEAFYKQNPPERVFEVDASHCVGFTKARQFLHILYRIARIVG